MQIKKTTNGARSADPDANTYAHVDAFIDAPFNKESYARWMFRHFRLPVIYQHEFESIMCEHKLFCTHRGLRYRCTGASRLGDVWLAEDFDRATGYDLRVNIATCSEWSPYSACRAVEIVASKCEDMASRLGDLVVELESVFEHSAEVSALTGNMASCAQRLRDVEQTDWPSQERYNK